MTKKIKHTVPILVWSKARQSVVPLDVTIEISLDRVALRLGERAMRSKHSKAQFMFGAIKATINKDQIK